ncbi:MAG: tRNA (N(6)-L-threonylcarbamoyladenosine(37)-C(2))-methylthiotransferase MtaB [Desulfatibacillaceae bacterium]
MTTRTFSMVTLGCKVNQYESDAIAEDLVRTGLERINGKTGAGVVVINTCTVTKRAGMQSRQSVRRAVKDNPDAVVAVTGCHAQHAPEEIAAIAGVDIVAGSSHKSGLCERLSPGCRQGAPLVLHEPMYGVKAFHAPGRVVRGARARPFLKVQDGCQAFCTYCIVPHTRGPSRSMEDPDVLRHLAGLARAGYAEAVLTGIHLGMYGRERGDDLVSLLRKIDSAGNMPRVRLSSIEPNEITPELLSVTANSGLVRPHMHVPLQSGDDDVLARMSRPYTSDGFAGVVRAVRDALPHAALGVDVLVGFPGETEKAFDNTLSLVESLPVNYLHVFPYSPREGTPAARFPDQVVQAHVTRRCAAMRQLGQRRREEFHQSMLGRTMPAVVERPVEGQKGLYRATTENYISVMVSSSRDLDRGTERIVRIREIRADRTVFAELVD